MIIFGGVVGSGVPGGAFSNETWALSLSTLTWTQLLPVGPLPPGRSLHCAIYDPIRDRMIIYGGYNYATNNDIWALDLSGTLAWSRIEPSAQPPDRLGASAVYDSRRDRMIVFGGRDSATYSWGDTYALSLSSGEWVELVPGDAGGPSARSSQSAVYDSTSDEILMFAGNVRPGGDLWALSLGTNEWRQIVASPAPAWRLGHEAVLDPSGRRMIVYGGRDNFRRRGDAWVFSLVDSQWTELIPWGDPPFDREDHSAIYDPVRDRMIVFGGWADDYPHNQTWVFSDGVGWSELATAGSPPWERGGHSAIYDPVGDRMIVFGGEEWDTFGNDVWALSLSGVPTWSELAPGGDLPRGRSGAGAVYDPVRKRMVVYAGLGGVIYPGPYYYLEILSDVWALSLADSIVWTELAPGGGPPERRESPSAIYDPDRDRMVVFGGYDYQTALNDVWALNLPGTGSWERLLPSGAAPAPRVAHTAVYDPPRRRMVVYGGTSADLNGKSDIWALSLHGSSEWTEIVPANSPPPARWGHSAIYDPVRERMVVFGGIQYYDTWALLMSKDAPTSVQVSFGGAETDGGHVKLMWQVAGGASGGVTLERRTPQTSWQAITEISPDGVGRIVYDDFDVAPGGRYAYRIVSRGSGLVSIEEWVDVPLTSRLSLAGFRPNPMKHHGRILFSLADANPARLEIFDVGGRRVMAEEIGPLGPGNHALEFMKHDMRAGVFLIRLTQGASAVTARGVIIQ